MVDRFQPVPQNAGALGPPDRHPPTAVGVATPPPPPNRGRPARPPKMGPVLRVMSAGIRQLRHLAGSVGQTVAGLTHHRASHGQR